jgi:uncharacterized protein (TIRG00374 family)
MSTAPDDLLLRFRRWVIGAIAIGALVYLVGSVWSGFAQVQAALMRFSWGWALPVVLLTLVNYGLRFVKWHYLLLRLGVKMDVRENLTNFIAGLAMVISPGKAGELLKPYVVRARTGAPMAQTIPALVVERLTDGIAMLILAGISVTTYAADKVAWIAVPAALIAFGYAALAIQPLGQALIAIAGRLPGLRKVAPKLSEMYGAMRICAAPAPLLITLLLSVVAWFAECVGFMLVFRGMEVDAPLDVCVFLYAFATVAGAAMPGGLGVSEGALAGGAVTFLHIDEGSAVAASLITRCATLWIGVAMGAFALFRVSALLGGPIALKPEGQEPA